MKFEGLIPAYSVEKVEIRSDEKFGTKRNQLKYWYKFFEYVSMRRLAR